MWTTRSSLALTAREEVATRAAGDCVFAAAAVRREDFALTEGALAVAESADAVSMRTDFGCFGLLRAFATALRSARRCAFSSSRRRFFCKRTSDETRTRTTTGAAAGATTGAVTARAGIDAIVGIARTDASTGFAMDVATAGFGAGEATGAGLGA